MQVGEVTRWPDGAITLGTRRRRGPDGPTVLWPAAQADTPMTGAVAEDLPGHGAPAAATSDSTNAGRLSSPWLRGRVGEVATVGQGAMNAREGLSPGPELGQYCLNVVEHVTNALFGPRIIGRPSAGRITGGISAGVVRDDGLLNAGEPARRQLGLPATAWGPLQEWKTVVEQVRAEGPGAAAVAVMEQPGTGQALELHHAVALVHTTDTDEDGHSMVVLIDPGATGQKIITSVRSSTIIWPGLINARTVLINADGNVVPPARTVPPESASTARALTHPTHPRIGTHPRREGPPHSRTQPHTPQPRSSHHPTGRPPPHTAPAPQPPVPSHPAWWGLDSRPPDEDEQRGIGQYYKLEASLARRFYRLPPRSNMLGADLFVRRDRQEILDATEAAFRRGKETHLANMAAQGRVESFLRDDDIRGLMTDSLRRQYPEIENLYLHRQITSSTIDSNYLIWAKRTVAVGDTQISVKYDPTGPASWLETRIEWIRRAVQHVQAAGFNVSSFEATIPKYTRRLEIGLAPGNSRTGRPELQITATPILGGVAANNGRSGMIIGSNLESYQHRMSTVCAGYDEMEVGAIVHEISHAENDHFRFADAIHTALIDPSKISHLAAISHYAAQGNHPSEFMAEYFVGLVFGRPYDLEFSETAAYLRELYDALGGPQQQFMRREEHFPTPIPLDGERLAFVVDQVNQRLRRRGGGPAVDGADVTYIHDHRLSPYERRLTLGRRAALIARNHMAATGRGALPPAGPTQPVWPAGHQAAAARLGVRLRSPRHSNQQLMPVLLNTMLAAGTGPNNPTERTLRQQLAATLNTLFNHPTPPAWVAQARDYLKNSHPGASWPQIYTALRNGTGYTPSHDPIAIFLAAIGLNIQIHHITDHGNVRSVGSPNAPEIVLAQINGQWIATAPYPDPHQLTQAVNALFPTGHIPQNTVMAISKALIGAGYNFSGNLQDWAWTIAMHHSTIGGSPEAHVSSYNSLKDAFEPQRPT